MKERTPNCISCRRGEVPSRDMAPTPAHFAAIRRAVISTAAGFRKRLSRECVEDLAQEVFLNLWKARAEDMLNCLPYVCRVAANVTIDLLRRQGAKKRTARRGISLDLEARFWPPSRTPEEILIEREEARQRLATDHALKRRVERAMTRPRERGRRAFWQRHARIQAQRTFHRHHGGHDATTAQH